jgi:hypothetical protein
MTDLTLTDAITLIKRMETDHLAALAEKDEEAEIALRVIEKKNNLIAAL